MTPDTLFLIVGKRLRDRLANISERRTVGVKLILGLPIVSLFHTIIKRISAYLGPSSVTSPIPAAQYSYGHIIGRVVGAGLLALLALISKQHEWVSAQGNERPYFMPRVKRRSWYCHAHPNRRSTPARLRLRIGGMRKRTCVKLTERQPLWCSSTRRPWRDNNQRQHETPTNLIDQY